MNKNQKLKVLLSGSEHKYRDNDFTLYSYDFNNNVIEIEVEKECGTVLDLTDYKADIVALFHKSNTKWETVPEIKDNKILFKFDTSLIDTDDVVKCALYLTKDDESNDVAYFHFKVKLSLKHQELKEKYVKDKKPDFVFNQVFSSAEWHIVHNLNKIPQVTVLDTSLKQHFGAVQHINNNELIIRFSVPFMGQAQLD